MILEALNTNVQTQMFILSYGVLREHALIWTSRSSSRERFLCLCFSCWFEVGVLMEKDDGMFLPTIHFNIFLGILSNVSYGVVILCWQGEVAVNQMCQI